jgi:hypothetical protein
VFEQLKLVDVVTSNFESQRGRVAKPVIMEERLAKSWKCFQKKLTKGKTFGSAESAKAERLCGPHNPSREILDFTVSRESLRACRKAGDCIRCPSAHGFISRSVRIVAAWDSGLSHGFF